MEELRLPRGVDRHAIQAGREQNESARAERQFGFPVSNRETPLEHAEDLKPVAPQMEARPPFGPAGIDAEERVVHEEAHGQGRVAGVDALDQGRLEVREVNARELHIPQSLASIDFNDFAPPLADTSFSAAGNFQVRPLVRNPLFNADVFRALAKETILFRQPRLRILAVLENRVTATAANVSVELQPGQFCLLPASSGEVALANKTGSSFLLVEPGE